MKLSHTNFAMLIMRLLSFVVSRFTNFSSLVSLAISLMVDLALLKRSSLRGAFEVHSVRKWTSLSILFSLHILQILRSASTGGLVCLPISISSWWELSLSLVNACLCLGFLINRVFIDVLCFMKLKVVFSTAN